MEYDILIIAIIVVWWLPRKVLLSLSMQSKQQLERLYSRYLLLDIVSKQCLAVLFDVVRGETIPMGTTQVLAAIPTGLCILALQWCYHYTDIISAFISK